MEIKEKNGKFYLLGDKERLEFITKEEAEKAAGILPQEAEVQEIKDAQEESLENEE